MDARTECMETMRELFRQFMSVLTREAVKLSQDYIYLDPRIAFTEIDRYFFSGCACAYFQIAVDIFTDLQFRSSEWADGFNPDKKASEIWLTAYSTRLKTIKAICQATGISVTEATEFVDGVPSIILSDTTIEKFNEIKPIFDEINATIEFK
jgi:cyclopropane fatty-acyl-phospholipid synthase-like methyltransferase